MILADRGFTIQDSAGLYCAEVRIPPFMKGKSQVNEIEIKNAHQLSHVCIHVERIIQGRQSRCDCEAKASPLFGLVK